ncbi:hypothetical protein KFK09_021362 [Dendrobium nobile]|uniref:Retrotransposon gag domain-containing protein n=1 Tax=Dendrobium nobile TaxID=94219 RepID=A0A8T3APX0_DENNO|nr:hypothetical protein KFK09_021362 [Dendrobium nobile]
MSEINSSQSIEQNEESMAHQGRGDLQSIQPSYRLNGRNYLKWSQFVRTYLKGKEKVHHLIGGGPKERDPKFEVWDEADSMIMSWLWNSMTPEISDTFMFISTAKNIWDAARQTYSKARDAAQIFEVKVKVGSTKQGSKTVTEYATILQNLWQELDHYRCIETRCPEDAAILKNFIEKDRVYDFLAGLNAEFDQVRVQILGKEETPSLNESISLICTEESRRGVMLEPKVIESSAMVMNKESSWKEKGKDSSKFKDKDSLWCNYCKKSRHTKETCWKIHGKPPSKEWNKKGETRSTPHANNTTSKLEAQSSLGEFNKEDINKLKRLLVSLEKPNASSSLALSAGHIFIQDQFWIVAILFPLLL